MSYYFDPLSLLFNQITLLDTLGFIWNSASWLWTLFRNFPPVAHSIYKIKRNTWILWDSGGVFRLSFKIPFHFLQAISRLSSFENINQLIVLSWEHSSFLFLLIFEFTLQSRTFSNPVGINLELWLTKCDVSNMTKQESILATVMLEWRWSI